MGIDDPMSDICILCIENPDANESLKVNWIECEICKRWYHIHCLNLKRSESESISEYHCPTCEPKNGPSIHKRKSTRARKKIDYIALDAGEQLREIDQHPHIRNFQAFENDKPLSELIYQVTPERDANESGIIDDEVITNIIFKTEMKRPILIPSCNPSLPNCKPFYDLTFKFPKLTVTEIAEYVGEDKSIPVMDVLTQNNSPNWTVGKWRDYFNSDAQDRDRIRNVISLEVSQTDLNSRIELPKSVLEVDIVNKLFSNEAVKESLEKNNIERPKVSKYLLMSVKDSFTDFHIDFGGTSVYYTILQGAKQFLMFPPTKRNLSIYEKWCLTDNQNSVWFADLVPKLPKRLQKGNGTTNTNNMKRNQQADILGSIDPAYLNNGIKIDINPGDLLILPSGWIHSVYTPCDSVIVGGNFLNLLSLTNHLKIYDIETNTKVPEKFKFPNFIMVVWLIGWYLMSDQVVLSDKELHCIVNLLPFYRSQLNLIMDKEKLQDKNYKRLIIKIKAMLPVNIIGKPAEFVDKFEAWYNNQLKIHGLDYNDIENDLEHINKRQKN